MSSHLGGRIGDLVDDRLTTSQRAGAQAHLEGCGRCRDEVAEHRQVKQRLAASSAPATPGGLSARLVAIAAVPPPPPGPFAAASVTGATRGRVLTLPGRPANRGGSSRPAPAPWSAGPGRAGRVRGPRLAAVALGAVGVLAALGIAVSATPFGSGTATPALSGLIERVGAVWHWPVMTDPAAVQPGTGRLP